MRRRDKKVKKKKIIKLNMTKKKKEICRIKEVNILCKLAKGLGDKKG